MKDRITCFKLHWYDWGLCCAEDAVQEEITIYRNKSILVIKELNGYGVICSCEIIHMEADKAKAFFEFLEKVSADWADDCSVEACDGSAWKMRMWSSSHKVKKVCGTVEYPPHGKEIENLIRSYIIDGKSTAEPRLFGCC